MQLVYFGRWGYILCTEILDCTHKRWLKKRNVSSSLFDLTHLEVLSTTDMQIYVPSIAKDKSLSSALPMSALWIYFQATPSRVACAWVPTSTSRLSTLHHSPLPDDDDQPPLRVKTRPEQGPIL
jgi:hypothetical protein